MRADEIKKALGDKYRSDQWLFLTEVKTGSTWFAAEGELKRIDAVAIKKSWSNPCIIAFEAKASRSDFMNDTKWPRYLPYCHRFYWACPSGLIKPSEVSDEAGLVWISEGGGIQTKKKALFRNVEIPASMFYHLLISKTKNGRHPFFSDEREYIQAYCLDKADRERLGALFKGKLVNRVVELQERVRQLENEAKRFEHEKDLLGKVTEIFHEHGVSTWNVVQALRDRLEQKHLPAHLIADLKQVKATLNRMKLE